MAATATPLPHPEARLTEVILDAVPSRSKRESKEKRAFDIVTLESVLFNQCAMLSSPENKK